tara:strand:+ start:811 stop:1239 length:429 start_codon:yes stop_codon:yes gene_type:complete
MLLISHRGNTIGPNLERENHPDYISEALKKNFYVEVDIWLQNNSYYLGHDEPMYDLSEDLLKNNKILFHAKNYEALKKLYQDKVHFFWHQNDDYTITSEGLIWVYPGKNFSKESIVVLPELFTKNLKLDCKGICSDFIENYK